jgi:hypothetical protein
MPQPHRAASAGAAEQPMRLNAAPIPETEHAQPEHAEATHAETTHTETPYGETPHAETPYGETTHAETSDGETTHAETTGGETIHAKRPAARTLGSPGGRLDRFDAAVHNWLVAHSIQALRLSLGGVFLGFGVLKLFPGISPAQNLVESTTMILTFGAVPGPVALALIGALELPSDCASSPGGACASRSTCSRSS